MFEKLEIFKMAQSLAGHAAARHSAIARNIANADTPGYRATDASPFSASYQEQTETSQMRATRTGHSMHADRQDRQIRYVDTGEEASPNGNTVSLENEMMKAAKVRHQHDVALSIYSASLNVIKTSLGRGR